MRRGSPELIFAALIALLLGSIVWYTQRVVGDLRLEAERFSRMYARIYRALGDTTEAASTQALLGLSRSIVDQGVPVIVTDAQGNPIEIKKPVLCRCGGSTSKPFCDGTHSRIGFQAAEAAIAGSQDRPA